VKQLCRRGSRAKLIFADHNISCNVARVFEKEIGKENTIEFLKKATAERMMDYGKRQASGVPNNDFDTYVNQFRSGYANTLTKEIVEDTEI
jgi:hypothetical protein